jgi:hypothetical protein
LRLGVRNSPLLSPRQSQRRAGWEGIELPPAFTPMDASSYRLLLLISFIAYMAAIYVALHIVVAHFSRMPGSRLLWFFSVLTAPLTRSIRRILPEGLTESQLRYLTLAVCVVIWLLTRLVLAVLGGVDHAGRG